MLFNSWIFIAVFLPAVLWAYHGLRHYHQANKAIWLLIIASLFFYGWWDVRYIPLLFGSVLINYWIGGQCYNGASRFWLIAGLVFNLGLLGYFKYAGFFMQNMVSLGMDVTVPQIVLPLAISFFTFQQIAYLVDSYGGKMLRGDFRGYALFVCFFPQLIAGPIVHHAEMLPQFVKTLKERLNWTLFTGGLVVFIIGLFKKVVIADRLAEIASPVFADASARAVLTFFESWLGALAYTFQLYFDFSGYSDMAIGIAAMFGIMLPLNFLSPYKATNIQAFWQRWHITLSRFLRDYLYIPLGGSHNGKIRHLAAIFVTFLLGGLWHGASWTFVIWGALHGAYLAGYHMLKFLPLPKILAWSITFLAVAISWVFFRADTLATALYMLDSMAGGQGVALFDASGGFAGFLNMLGIEVLQTDSKLLRLNDKLYLLLGAALIAFLAPSTHEIMRGKVALNTAKALQHIDTVRAIRFEKNWIWAVYIGVLAAAALLSLNSVSEFLYFQF